MEHRQHEQIARWERRWLAFSGVISVGFVLLIAYNLAIEGTHIAQRSDRGTPEQLLAQEIFAEPGVRALGPGRYQVTGVAQAFTFQPADVRVPIGAELDFYLTSRDVLHGYQVEDTNINVEVIPGEVSSFEYTFHTPGEYRVTCNEYCGIGHHTMLGTITVVPASQWTGVDAPVVAGDGGAAADGSAVYAANCASCHQAEGQGIPGAFPPVAGHAAELVADEGRDYLPLVLLYGLEGPIEVQGQTYDGVMPAWAQLSNDELAAVANHIVGLDPEAAPDGFEPYTPDEIEAARGQELSPGDVHARRTE